MANTKTTTFSHYDSLFEEENNDFKSAPPPAPPPTTTNNKSSPNSNNKKHDLIFKPTFFKSKQNKQLAASPSKKQQKQSPIKQQESQSTANTNGIMKKKTIKFCTDTETTTTTTIATTTATKCLRLTRNTRNNKKTPNSTEDSIGSSANSSCSSTTSISSNDAKSNDLLSPLKQHDNNDHNNHDYDFNDAFIDNNNKKNEQDNNANMVHSPPPPPPTTTTNDDNNDEFKLIDDAADNHLTTKKLLFKKSNSNCIYNTNNNIPSFTNYQLPPISSSSSSHVTKLIETTTASSSSSSTTTVTNNKISKKSSYDYDIDDDEDDDSEFEKRIKCKLKLTKSSSDTTSPTTTSIATTSCASSSINCNNTTTTTSTAITSTNSRYLGPKRIFSSKQTSFKSITSTTSANSINKLTSSKYNYNLFDYSDEKTDVKNRNDDDFNEEDSSESISSNCAIKTNDNHQLAKTKSLTNNQQQQQQHSNDGYTTVLLCNTRKAYECEELGETQGFTDDILYLMDGLNENFQLANRCLSAIKLAEYCVNSDFRMHLRSQGTVTKIFNLLHDSPKDHNLALCTACIMYALSRDKLIMDLDKSILELMIMILNMDLPKKDDLNTQLYKKNYEQCKNVCKKLNDDETPTAATAKCESTTTTTKLDLDNLNANLLAMECLLSLTNRRTGEWCKEELRLLGALDHILNTIDKCVSTIINNNSNRNSQSLIITTDNIVKYTRCLKVLENVTHANKENQKYICTYNNSFFVKLFKNSLNCFYKQLMSKNLDQLKKKINSDAIKDTFLLLINITHNNEIGCEILSNNEEFIETIFIFIHECISYLTENEQFDVLIMALGVLLNLLDVNKEYRKKINRQIKLTNGQIISSLDIIINLYNNKQTEVSKAETDQEQEWAKLNQEIETQNVENINITVMNSIHKAGKHMEDHIIAANSAIIIGYVLLNDQSSADEIRIKLNNETFDNMLEILKKFVLFMKIMKVTGFSVDEHLQEILTNLDKLNKAFTKIN